jgi:hypothetical protein
VHQWLACALHPWTHSSERVGRRRPPIQLGHALALRSPAACRGRHANVHTTAGLTGTGALAHQPRELLFQKPRCLQHPRTHSSNFPSAKFYHGNATSRSKSTGNLPLDPRHSPNVTLNVTLNISPFRLTCTEIFCSRRQCTTHDTKRLLSRVNRRANSTRTSRCVQPNHAFTLANFSDAGRESKSWTSFSIWARRGDLSLGGSS